MAKVEKSKSILEKALYLSKKGDEFTLRKINNSFTLESKWFGNCSSSANKKIAPIELGFIKRVKNYIIKNMVYDNFMETLYYPIDIMYVEVKKYPPETEFKRIVEIDIDEAYWKTAQNLKVISPELYEEGSKEFGKISKFGRLVSLGSLAKKEMIYSYQGSRLIRSEVKRSTLTENIWYSICKRVSDVMFEARNIAGENFVLYWVDGIYIEYNEKKIQEITKMFKSYGYDVKVKDNYKAFYTENKVVVEDLNNPDTEKNQRQFFIAKQARKNTYFTDDQLKKTALKYSKYGAMDDLDEDEL